MILLCSRAGLSVRVSTPKIQPALVKVPAAAASSSHRSVTAAAHPSSVSGGIPQTAAAAWGRDGWGKPVQPLTSLQCRTGEGSLGSRLLDDICVCAHHGTLSSTAPLTPAKALRPAAHISDEFTYSLCSADAGPGLFPYRDVSSLDKICTLTFEVNNLQVGILFLQRKPFPSIPTTKTGLPVRREATSECLEILRVRTRPTRVPWLLGSSSSEVPPTSPLNGAWFPLSFFTSLEKADPWPRAPTRACAGLGVFSRHFFLKQIQMCAAAVPRGATPLPHQPNRRPVQ